MTYYILRKGGPTPESRWGRGYEGGKPHKIAVHDGTRRAEKTVELFQGWLQDFPPEPKVLGVKK